jgi:hypothetical protein
MTNTTQKLCVTAMGIALFVVLALCLQVPVFENYYLCLGYIAMMVFCYHFGVVSGVAVGVLGVVLYCLLTNGIRGMPGWATGNLVIGLAVGLSCRFFKKMTGRSALAYVNEYRIEKATVLLTKTDEPIGEIAESVGFDDLNYFSRVFKKVKKCSPGEYRKIHTQGEKNERNT